MRRRQEIFGRLPATDVHKLEIRIRRNSLMQRGVHIAWLGHQVIAGQFPASNEAFRVSRGNVPAPTPLAERVPVQESRARARSTTPTGDRALTTH